MVHVGGISCAWEKSIFSKDGRITLKVAEKGFVFFCCLFCYDLDVWFLYCLWPLMTIIDWWHHNVAFCFIVLCFHVFCLVFCVWFCFGFCLGSLFVWFITPLLKLYVLKTCWICELWIYNHVVKCRRKLCCFALFMTSMFFCCILLFVLFWMSLFCSFIKKWSWIMLYILQTKVLLSSIVTLMYDFLNANYLCLIFKVSLMIMIDSCHNLIRFFVVFKKKFLLLKLLKLHF